MESPNIHNRYVDWMGSIKLTNVKDFDACKNLYEELIEKHKDDLHLLALLEITVRQISDREQAKNKIKLSEVRGYIYARAPFFKPGVKLKDLRVVAGKMVDYNISLDELYSNPEFMTNAKLKLIEAMNEKIQENLSEIQKLKEKILSL